MFFNVFILLQKLNGLCIKTSLAILLNLKVQRYLKIETRSSTTHPSAITNSPFILTIAPNYNSLFLHFFLQVVILSCTFKLCQTVWNKHRWIKVADIYGITESIDQCYQARRAAIPKFLAPYMKVRQPS